MEADIAMFTSDKGQELPPISRVLIENFWLQLRCSFELSSWSQPGVEVRDERR